MTGGVQGVRTRSVGACACLKTRGWYYAYGLVTIVLSITSWPRYETINIRPPLSGMTMPDYYSTFAFLVATYISCLFWLSNCLTIYLPWTITYSQYPHIKKTHYKEIIQKPLLFFLFFLQRNVFQTALVQNNWYTENTSEIWRFLAFTLTKSVIAFT